MDVWGITLAALRRWYVLLVLLGLTGWAVMTVGSDAEPEYNVAAVGLMVPGPAESTVPNPYGTAGDATSAVAIVLNGPRVREEIAEQGLPPDYEVMAEQRSTILRFTVVAPTPEVGARTGEALFEQARAELADRQSAAGLAPDAQFTLDVLSEPSVAEVVYESRLRVQAVVGGVGALLALVVAVLFDDIVGLVRRRLRRGSPAGPPTTNQTEQPASGVEHDALSRS